MQIKLKKCTKKYYETHADKVKEMHKKYYKTHVDKIKEYRKHYQKNYRKGHPDKIKKYNKTYREKKKMPIQNYQTHLDRPMYCELYDPEKHTEPEIKTENLQEIYNILQTNDTNVLPNTFPF